MDHGATIERDRTILLRDGRIVAVGKTEELTPPSDARVVDVRGLYVMPGLAGTGATRSAVLRVHPDEPDRP